MKVSVIIPSLHTGDAIYKTLRSLCVSQGDFDITISHHGQRYTSAQDIVSQYPCVAIVHAPYQGRAKQMNYAVQYVLGEILYFVHADTIVAPHWYRDIMQYYKPRSQAGSFWMSFDTKHWFLGWRSYATRLPYRWARFGDQTLYVSRSLYDTIGGYNECYPIEEDNDFAYKVYRHTQWTVIPHYVTTSSARYNRYGVYYTQFVFSVIHICYLCGISPSRLYVLYRYCFS